MPEKESVINEEMIVMIQMLLKNPGIRHLRQV